jgi:hypothetical protein
VWLTYASYFYFRFVNRWGGRRMAWWSIIGFAITIFCFLGVNSLLPSLHSAMPVTFQQLLHDAGKVSLQALPGLCHDQPAGVVAA